MLSFLSSREKASYDELAEFLSVTKARVNQILDLLRKAHILVQEGIGRRIWFKLGSPEDEPDETVLKSQIKKKLNRRPVDKQKVRNKAMEYQKVSPIFEELS